MTKAEIKQESWSYQTNQTYGGEVGAIVYSGKKTVCRIPATKNFNEVNVRLIAAAPELLEVLQKIVAIADSDPFTSIGHIIEHSSNARAVIAKLKGK